jgi:hypothetical protein
MAGIMPPPPAPVNQPDIQAYPYIMHREDAKGAKNRTNLKNLRVLRSFAVNL